MGLNPQLPSRYRLVSWSHALEKAGYVVGAATYYWTGAGQRPTTKAKVRVVGDSTHSLDLGGFRYCRTMRRAHGGRTRSVISRLAWGAAVVSLMVAALAAGGTAEAASPTARWRTPLPSTAKAAYAPSREQCGDLLFIGARGSAETDVNKSMRTFGATVQRVRDALKATLRIPDGVLQVRQVWVDYPAPAVSVLLNDVRQRRSFKDSKYFSGTREGIDEAAGVLQGSINNCPDERWSFAGYSQGTFLGDEMARRFDVPARWVGNLAVANISQFPGRRVTTSGSAFTDGGRPWGAFASLSGRRTDLPADLRRASLSYCLRADPMCDYAARRLPNLALPGGGRHGTYKDDRALSAAVRQFAVGMNERLRARPSSATRFVTVHPWKDSGIAVVRDAAAVQCATSRVSERSDAWRCFRGSIFSDPCFSDASGTSVRCLEGQDFSTYRQYARAFLNGGGSSASGEPFGMLLADGNVCLTESGAGPRPPSGYRSWVGACTSGSSSFDNVLWGSPTKPSDDVPYPALFVRRDSSGQLFVALGAEGAAPRLEGVRTAYR